MSSDVTYTSVPVIVSAQAAGVSSRDRPHPSGVRDCMRWPVDVEHGVDVTSSKAIFLPKKAELGKSQGLGFKLPSIPSAVKKPEISMESVGLALCGWPGNQARRNRASKAMQNVASAAAEGRTVINGDLADYRRDRSLPTNAELPSGGKPKRNSSGSGRKKKHCVSNDHHNLSPSTLELNKAYVHRTENGIPKTGDTNNRNGVPTSTTTQRSVHENQSKSGSVPANATSNNNGNINDSRKIAPLTTGKLPAVRKPRTRLLHRVRVSRVPSGTMGDLMSHQFLTEYIERQSEANKRRHLLADAERLSAKRRVKLVRGNKTSELRASQYTGANPPKAAPPPPGQRRTLWKMTKFTRKAQPHFTTFRRTNAQSHSAKSAASEMSQDGADTLSEGTTASNIAEVSSDAAI